MRVERLCWIGTQAPDAGAYEHTVAFFREALGLRPVLEETGTTEFELPSGDRVQVYAAGGPIARAPLPLFEIDDARAARDELSARGIEVGELHSDSAWEWFRLRAPDGNDYELGARR